MRLARGAALALVVAAAHTGCRSAPNAMTRPDRPAPSYGEVASAWNARAERLGRLWARAVVQVRYVDEDGDRRSVQGEGHLQLIQPNRLALSAGKLGETLFWLGGDDERFWAFELGDASRASVGRHDNVGRPCSTPLAAPVHPLEAIDMLGVAPLPAPGSLDSEPPVAWSDDGLVRVDAMGRFGPMRLFLEPEELLPVRIELIDSRDQSPVIIATLEDHERVALSGSPGYNPQVASRVVIEHPGTESEVRLTLSDLNDGSGRGRLSDAAFTFESLLRAFRPEEIVVLDASCERPAFALGPGGGP